MKMAHVSVRIRKAGTETASDTACCYLQLNSRRVMQTITWLHNNFLHQQDLSKHPNIKQQMAGWRMHYSHAVI